MILHSLHFQAHAGSPYLLYGTVFKHPYVLRIGQPYINSALHAGTAQPYINSALLRSIVHQAFSACGQHYINSALHVGNLT